MSAHLATRRWCGLAVTLAAFLFSAAAQAQAHAHAIGRLFTTPEERYRLDQGRGLIAAPAPVPKPVPVAEAQQPPQPRQPPPAPVTVDGVIRRSDGRATVWIDGQPQDRRIDLASPRQPPRVGITLPSGEQVRLKPGQSVDMGTGAVREADGR